MTRVSRDQTKASATEVLPVLNQVVAVAGLVAHAQNYKGHPAKQVERLRLSLRKFGQVRSIVVQAPSTAAAASAQDAGEAGRYTIVAGHGVVQAAVAEGYESLRADVLPATWPAERVKAYLVADNELGRLAENDEAQLAALIEEARAFDGELLGAMGFDEAEFQALLASVAGEQPGGDPGAQLNRAEELREKYQATRGQVWELGRHRLMCGDAYNEADRQHLLGGETPAMLHIDPPYGINIVQPRKNSTAADSGGSKPFGGTSGTERHTGAAERSARAERGHVQHGEPSKNQIIQSNLYPVIEGDDRPFDPTLFLGLAPVVIMWGGNYFADRLPASPCWIVWDKREDITRNTFADCEMAWTNLAKPARLFHHLWNGLHKGSQYGERRTHPTEKPVALFDEIGKMFCPTGVWLDLFAGTGAQIMAAERIPEVRCLACEIEPLYVAVVLDRWSTMTGKTPVLLSAQGVDAGGQQDQQHGDQ